MTRRAAVFIENYGLGRCSVALCILEMLSEEYRVDLLVSNVWLGESPVLSHKSVRIIDLAWHGGWIRHFFRVLRRPALLRSLADRVRLSWLKRNAHYDLHLTFDPHGFVRCLELFPRARPFYVSLELYFKTNFFNLVYPDAVMQCERAAINDIEGLVIQSRERESLFRSEYGLKPEIPTFLLPVVHAGPVVRRKSQFLRARYKIADQSRILLHLGGIAPYFCCLEMVQAFQAVQGWTMVFHGHAYPGYVEKLRAEIGRLNLDGRVFISPGIVGDLKEIDEIVSSADAGICWYDDVSPNLTSAGKSSGKTAAYLRFGLPVITNGYPSSRDAIEKTECGVCIDNLETLPATIQIIESQYDRFSSNAFREYEHTYWFEVYREDLKLFLKTPHAKR